MSEISEIINIEDPVNSAVNHNVNPPRPETTGSFWRIKEAALRRKNDIIDLQEFTR